MLRVLLIDDEASARADLRQKLAAHPGMVVVGEAATVQAARDLFVAAEYDLVFLDVQLIGGDSFDLVPLVRAGASIVFATAHERYAVRAFENHAVDYLLKPIDSARLAEALRRAEAACASGAHGAQGTAAPAPPACPTSIASAASPRSQVVQSEIALADDERAFLRQMIETWEDTLHAAHILRVQRAHLRTVRYQRDGETRVFLTSAPVSALRPIRRWWRAFRG